jgi:hydrogenase expression/formation protein HypC
MSDTQPGRCTDDVCITCGDVAVPVRVLRLLPGDLAVVEVDGHEEEVSVALVSAGVGARLLVHAGEAIASLEDAPGASGPAAP